MHSVSPGLKRKGGGGIEHLEAVHALAHTLLAYTTILCCMNTVKRGVLPPFPPLGKTLIHHYIICITELKK